MVYVFVICFLIEEIINRLVMHKKSTWMTDEHGEVSCFPLEQIVKKVGVLKEKYFLDYVVLCTVLLEKRKFYVRL
jgi:hypothetical protein